MQFSFDVDAAHAGWCLKDFLRINGVSSAAIRAVKLLPQGILVNGVKANTNYKLNAGDTVCMQTAEDKETLVTPQDIPLEIVYESDSAMVLNKPAGMPVHPTRGHVSGTLANAFCGLMQRRGTPMPFRAVNRIDKNTSGLVLLALSSFAVPFLSKSVQKEYLAIVEGVPTPPTGVISAPIARCASSIITREVNENGKRAVTNYKLLASGGEVSLISAELVTGRTHQIRVHFSHLGMPLCGDDLYGGSTQYISRHALHCARLKFTEPMSKKEILCKSTLPQDMSNLLNNLEIIW